jgi:DNA-binding transcriptional LysR family regulator
MELRHARYFVAVAEELNFRRAAERLHLAQPSLSTQIRLLEEDIRVQLLERDSHKVELTPAGRSFLEGCRRLLQDADNYIGTARRIARGESVPLSIGFVPSLAHGLLPSVLRLFRQRFPDVQLLLSEMDSTAQIEQIAGNRIDLGLIGLGLPKDIPELEIVVVAEERLWEGEAYMPFKVKVKCLAIKCDASGSISGLVLGLSGRGKGTYERMGYFTCGQETWGTKQFATVKMV